MRACLVAIVAIVACAACHATLTHGNGDDSDAAVVQDAPPSQPDAAKVCSGGDGHASDPMGNCFVFNLGPKTWAEANTACLAMPAKLAKITSAAQNTMIATLTAGHVTFLGATDSATEGTFLWTDGSALTYDNFRSGVPNNGGTGGNEDCLVIEGNKTPNDSWDDRPCDASQVPTSGVFAYLCEY